MKFFTKIKNVIGTAEDVVYPHYACVVCGRESPSGQLCENCKQYLIAEPCCAICGEHISDGGIVCDECKDGRLFDKNRSVFVYGGNVAESILALKFRGAKYKAIDFAKLLAQKYSEFGEIADVVCYVPATQKRERLRGYNQAKELALEFCKITGLPFVELLTKTKETGHQAELSREERLTNLANSFAVTDRWLARNRKVLVIDDVLTTGSTLNACAKVLKHAHAKKVYCLTIAKTEYKLIKKD
jgi:ComF family protein